MGFREVGGGESNRAPWRGVGGTAAARVERARGGVFIVNVEQVGRQETGDSRVSSRLIECLPVELNE